MDGYCSIGLWPGACISSPSAGGGRVTAHARHMSAPRRRGGGVGGALHGRCPCTLPVLLTWLASGRWGGVAYIETDPGQTEFTPSGMLALHVINKRHIGTGPAHAPPLPVAVRTPRGYGFRFNASVPARPGRRCTGSRQARHSPTCRRQSGNGSSCALVRGTVERTTRSATHPPSPLPPRPCAGDAAAARTVSACFLGAVSPRDDPAQYIATVADLVSHSQTSGYLNGLPVVVNTPGWIKGSADRHDRRQCVAMIGS